jgi:hypothetical protein
LWGEGNWHSEDAPGLDPVRPAKAEEQEMKNRGLRRGGPVQDPAT